MKEIDLNKCEMCDEDKKSCECKLDGILIKDLENCKIVRWMKLEHKKPPVFEDLLVSVIANAGTSFKGGERYIAVDRLVSEDSLFRTEILGFGRVTHWMTLPEAPNE